MLSCKVNVKDKDELSIFDAAIIDLYGIERYGELESMFNNFPEGYYLTFDAESEQVKVGYSAHEHEKYKLTLSLNQFDLLLWYLKEIKDFEECIEDTKENIENLFNEVTQKYHLIHPYIYKGFGYLGYNKEENYYYYGSKGTSDMTKTSFTAEECDELEHMFPEATREEVWLSEE